MLVISYLLCAALEFDATALARDDARTKIGRVVPSSSTPEHQALQERRQVGRSTHDEAAMASEVHAVGSPISSQSPVHEDLAGPQDVDLDQPASSRPVEAVQASLETEALLDLAGGMDDNDSMNEAAQTTGGRAGDKDNIKKDRTNIDDNQGYLASLYITLTVLSIVIVTMGFMRYNVLEAHKVEGEKDDQEVPWYRWTRQFNATRCWGYAGNAVFCTNGWYSLGSVNAVFSFFALNCLYSILSVNSVYSVFSVNSAFSVMSVNSMFSVGCHHGSFEVCTGS